MRRLKDFYQSLSWQTQLEIRIGGIACVLVALGVLLIAKGA